MIVIDESCCSYTSAEGERRAEIWSEDLQFLQLPIVVCQFLQHILHQGSVEKMDAPE